MIDFENKRGKDDSWDCKSFLKEEETIIILLFTKWNIEFFFTIQSLDSQSVPSKNVLQPS